MVGLTPILYIFLKVLSIFVETLDCVKYFVWVVFSLLIPPFIWNREICNLTWTWFWAKTLRLENTILPPSLGREIVLYKTLLLIGKLYIKDARPAPAPGKMAAPTCSDPKNFQDGLVPPHPPREKKRLPRPKNIEKCSGADSGKMFKLHQNVLGIKKFWAVYF